MTTVGVRELRQRASDLLRRVAQGETIEITDRGRPVALLSPIPAAGALERMRAAGEVELAQAGLDTMDEPLRAEAGGELPSQLLSRLREGER